MSCTHEDREEFGIMVADSFEVDFCQHGYGQLSFFRKGAKKPFAVAYFGPGAVIDMARTFTEAIRTEGNA